MHHLSKLLFFGIPLFYYYINLNSSIISSLSCEDIYLFFGISLLASFECNSLDFSACNSVETLVISLAILLPIKSSVASAVVLIALFETVFIESVADFLALSTSF